MLQTVLNDKKGLTLVEVVIALTVLLIVFLALMQTALVSIDANMINVLRDEAVSIAEERMSEARNIPFDNLAAGTTDVSPPPRSLRNIPSFSYTAMRTVSSAGPDAMQVGITVTWEWKEKTGANAYTHSISTIVRRR